MGLCHDYKCPVELKWRGRGPSRDDHREFDRIALLTQERLENRRPVSPEASRGGPSVPTGSNVSCVRCRRPRIPTPPRKNPNFLAMDDNKGRVCQGWTARFLCHGKGPSSMRVKREVVALSSNYRRTPRFRGWKFQSRFFYPT